MHDYLWIATPRAENPHGSWAVLLCMPLLFRMDMCCGLSGVAPAAGLQYLNVEHKRFACRQRTRALWVLCSAADFVAHPAHCVPPAVAMLSIPTPFSSLPSPFRPSLRLQ